MRHGFSFISTFLLLVVLLLGLSVCSVEAKDCRIKDGMRAWKHDRGSFLYDDQSKMWHEVDNKGSRLASFKELQRQEGQVLLIDEKRNMHLLLRSDLCALRNNGEENFRQLYAGKFMRIVDCTRHGRLRFPLGSGFLTVGHDLNPIIPSNDLYYDPPKLRHRLDSDGYLYFKNIIPQAVINVSMNDLGYQMLQCGWTRAEDRVQQMERDGVALGIPFPSDGKLPPPQIKYTESLRSAVSGTSVMALVRQVFGGAVNVMDVQSLHLAAPRETFGLRMSSVYMNKGTKLALVALVPFHDIPLQMGTPVVVKGSNSTDSYAALRRTYGQHEVETGDIRGDGCYTHDPRELLPLGKQGGIDEVTGRSITIDVNPFLSTSFEAGDVLLMTVYTMYSFLTNTTNCWRVMAEAVWTMEGDNVGPDPRYVGTDAPGLTAWYADRDDAAKYPRTMDEAKRQWGLLPAAPTELFKEKEEKDGG